MKNTKIELKNLVIIEMSLQAVFEFSIYIEKFRNIDLY